MNRLALLHTGLSLGVILLITGAIPNSAGAPSGHTGAPGSNTCIACHTGNDLNANGGSIALAAPASYVPGSPVELSLTVERAGQVRFGFSITVRDADGNMVGTWEPVEGEGTGFSDFGGDPTHLTHNPAVSVLDRHTWALRWNAPAEDVGPVTFYAAGNAANGFSNFGDFIYTTSASVSPAADTATESGEWVLPLTVTSVYPAPARDRATFVLTAQRPGPASVHFYDASGRRMLTVEQNVSAGENALDVDLSTLSTGWYAWRIEMDGHSATGSLTTIR